MSRFYSNIACSSDMLLTEVHIIIATWKIRNTHMMDTHKRLMELYGEDNSKSIVWAHNTRIGDAKQTDMVDAKMINIHTKFLWNLYHFYCIF